MTANEQAGEGSSPRFVNWFLGLGTLALLLFLAAVFFGTKLDKRPHDQLERYTPITKNLSKTATLTLYEGLPHFDEATKLYEQELAAKKTLRIHEYAFYETPLTVSADDLEKLRSLCTGNYVFSKDTYKRCSFHPDYCLVWKDGATNYEVLLCLTCKQVKFFTAEEKAVSNLQVQGDDQFSPILKKYVNQRPPKEKRR